MPQTGYDRDADERHAPAAGGESFEDQIKGDFSQRDAAGMEQRARYGAAEDIANAPLSNSALNNLEESSGSGIGTGAESSSPTELANKEQKEGQDGGGLYNSDKDQAPSKRQKIKNGFGKLKRNKLLVGGTVGAGGIVVAILILIALIASSLKVPALIAHVTAYRFASVTRQAALGEERITLQRIALQALDNEHFAPIKAKYGDASGKVKGVYDKIANKLSVNRIINNYQTSGTFKLVYDTDPAHTSILRGQPLTGIQVGDQTLIARQVSGIKGLIPGVKFFNRIGTATNAIPYLKAALKADDYGPIMRYRIAKGIRSDLGISLIAYKAAEYRGKKLSEAEVKAYSDGRAAINKGEATGALTDSVTDGAKSVVDETNKALETPEGTTDLLKRGGIARGVADILARSTSPAGFLKNVALIGSPLAIITPVCLIYDGSIVKAGPTINQQSDNVERTYYHYSSADAQQRNGYDANLTAIAALDFLLGDISKSNPEILANTGKINTSNYQSIQATSTGSYTNSIFDIFGPAKDSAQYIADYICPAAENTWLNAGISFVGIGACIASSGLGCAGKEALQKGAETLLGRITSKITAKLVVNFTEKSSLGVATSATKYGAIGDLLTKGLKQSGLALIGIEGATLLAQSLIVGHSSIAHNGLQTNTALANDIDNGGDQAAKKIYKKQLYARPLTPGETTENSNLDKYTVAAANASKSAYQRYAAMSNPNSLLFKLGEKSASMLQLSTIPNFLNSLGDIFTKPLQFMVSLGMPKANAAVATTESDQYGNVGYGYSKEENLLLQNDQSYQPLDNQYFLDSSGKEDEIAKKYQECFDAPMGDLLSQGKINRDDQGNVLSDDALCSPVSLGLRNPDYKDLVFRWRAAMSDNNMLGQMIDTQDLTAIGTGPATQPNTAATDTTVPVNTNIVTGDTTKTPCAPGTTEAGTADGYKDGKKILIRLCTVALGTTVNSEISGNIYNLIIAAKAAGFTFAYNDGFATMDQQITKRKDNGCPDIYNAAADTCKTPTSRPGYSSHQMGLAIDFKIDGQLILNGPAFEWLAKNAGGYGMKNYPAETWHWSVDGN